MYLLDTNYCSKVVLGDAAAIARLRSIDADHIAVSAIIRGELVYMAEKSERRDQNLLFVHAFLQRFHTYQVDADTADVYGRLKSYLLIRFGPKDRSKRRRATIEEIGFTDNDLWIAATAIQHNLTIVSSDSDFQRMQEAWSFPVETW